MSRLEWNSTGNPADQDYSATFSIPLCLILQCLVAVILKSMTTAQSTP